MAMPDRYGSRGYAGTLIGFVALLLSSCQGKEGFPISEEATAVALKPIATAALDEVRAARRSSETEKAERDEHLQRAESHLRKLTEYYLPLLDARDRAYEAYRLYYLRPAAVGAELTRIEEILRSIAEARGSRVEASMVDALELVTEARTEIAVDSASASKHLQNLARRLSYMLLKGELIL